MNTDTAIHLNDLLTRSHPVVLSPEFKIMADPDTGDVHFWPHDVLEALWSSIEAVLSDAYPHVVCAEIVDAAINHREAYIDTLPAHSVYRAKDAPLDPDYCGSLVPAQWRHSDTQIRALVEADNMRRMADYETYRRACAHGVAVPPEPTR